MPEISGTRVLFLDDSGKPSFNDPTQAVVLGGFSVPSSSVTALSRSVIGAKARYFPARGDARSWELKSRRLLRRHRLRGSRYLRFVLEIVRILERLDCTVYTAGITKHRMLHEMNPETSMILQLRALSEHFAVECALRNETGVLVSDWTDERLVAKVSRDIARFIAEHELPLHPGIYFSDSVSSEAIQVADLVAGTRRRLLEGDRQIRSVAGAIVSVRSLPEGLAVKTHTGRAFSTAIHIV